MARILPSDLSTEKIVLGLAINDDKMANIILANLNIDDFANENMQNRIIFEAIKRIKDRHMPIDFTTVSTELNVMKQYDNVGGYNYLFELSEGALATTNVDFYINNLRDFTLLRKFITTIENIKKEYDEKDIVDINEFITKSSEAINDVAKNRRIRGFKKTEELATEIANEIIKRVGGDSSTLPGISTGFSCLDNITGGFKRGELIYLAARPSVGKTTFALNLCYNVAKNSGRPVIVFELEMGAHELIKKLLASQAMVDYGNINRGYVSEKDKLKIKSTAEDMAKIPLYINDSTVTSIDTVLAASRKIKDELGDLALIMIDYIGILADPINKNKNSSRENDISSYSRKLKELALELKCPILCLSQLARRVESRDDRRPELSDLRESGSLEQDCDKAILMYRPAYYENQGISIKGGKYGSKFKDKKDNNLSINEQRAVTTTEGGGDIVELNLAKNRNGQTGTTTVLFLKNYGRFVVPSSKTQESLEKFAKD